MPGTRENVLDEILAFVRRGYELWNAGDLASVSHMWSDDFEWHNAPEWPGQSVYYGREQAVRFLTDEVAEVILLNEIEVERIVPIGDELVICMVARTRGHDSNLDFGKVPIFHVALVRDGKVARVRAFLDEKQAMAAAQRGLRQGSTAG
ncbi:MAG: SnoaL-like domain [Thermoleophilaceae bacterium]|nr:SnoaL-like domain [Thermoleophilaceae bacterium]